MRHSTDKVTNARFGRAGKMLSFHFDKIIIYTQQAVSPEGIVCLDLVPYWDCQKQIKNFT